MIEISKLVGGILLFLAGFGGGFLLACYGAAQIVVKNKDLKDELTQIRGERDLLADELRKNTKTIEIKDTRASTTGDYFKPF